jgi:hypothetical protein
MHSNRATDMSDPSSPAAFRDLMAAIGFLMFHWSLLEHELGEEIIRLRSISGDLSPSRNRLRATPNERLAEWSALQSRRRRRDVDFQRAVVELGERIQALGRLRTLVTHGFVTAGTEPESGPEPWIMCSNAISGIGTPDIRLTLTELHSAIEAMDVCRDELIALGAEVDQPG